MADAACSRTVLQERIRRKRLARGRLERAYAFDIDENQARQFASTLSQELAIEVQTVRDLAVAARRSSLCVTCTPSTRPFLSGEHVAPGAFIAAVGADSPEKQELDPALLASNKIVVDHLEQCATIGELHHAIEKGLAGRESVYAELGEVVAGRKPGRTSTEEIIIFDSTGIALQDVAAAAIVYEKAVSAGRAQTLDFAE